MTISALPTPPSRSDSPGDFATKGDAFLGALPTFATEANALAGEVNADAAAAAGSASTATTQAGIATTQAGIATTQAGIAAGHASDALGHANTASGAAASAIASFDQFDARYLGAKASDPSTDNEGNPLVAGALYYKTGDGMRVWDGSAWQAAYVPESGYVTLSGTQTLTNKTLNDPKISLGGTNGTAGQVPVSQGAGLPPVWGAKQDQLVSGTNIKTVNGASVLGSGDLVVGGGAWVLLSTVTANNSATVDLESGVGSTYDDYVVIAENVSPSSSQLAMFRIKAGGSYLSSSIYGLARSGANSSGPQGSSGDEVGIYVSLTQSSTGGQSYVAYFMNCNSTSNKNAVITGGNSVQIVTASASISTSSAAQGFRFMFTGGNVVTGTFRLYGIKKS